MSRIVGRQNATVQLQVRLVDAEYRPLDNAHITLTVTGPEKQEIVLTTTGSGTETGVYTAQY